MQHRIEHYQSVATAAAVTRAGTAVAAVRAARAAVAATRAARRRGRGWRRSEGGGGGGGGGRQPRRRRWRRGRRGRRRGRGGVNRRAAARAALCYLTFSRRPCENGDGSCERKQWTQLDAHRWSSKSSESSESSAGACSAPGHRPGQSSEFSGHRRPSNSHQRSFSARRTRVKQGRRRRRHLSLLVRRCAWPRPYCAILPCTVESQLKVSMPQDGTCESGDGRRERKQRTQPDARSSSSSSGGGGGGGGGRRRACRAASPSASPAAGQLIRWYVRPPDDHHRSACGSGGLSCGVLHYRRKATTRASGRSLGEFFLARCFARGGLTVSYEASAKLKFHRVATYPRRSLFAVAGATIRCR